MSDRRQRIEDNAFKHAQKFEGKRSNVYLDPKGIPTIGYGYALGDKDGNLKSSGQVNREMNDKLGTKDKVYFTDQDMDKLKNAKSDKDLKGVGPSLDDNQMDSMLKGHVKEHADRVDGHIKSLGRNPENFTDAEREAMIDLSLRGGDNLIGKNSPKLNDAIKEGDKDAFLKEVEEGSNGDNLPGNDVRMKELGGKIREELQEQKKQNRLEEMFPPMQDNGGDKSNTPTDDSSLLDDIGDGASNAASAMGDALQGAGNTLVTGGKIAFNTAMNLSMQTAGNAVSQAITSGGSGDGKEVVRQAAKATLGQMLGQFQGMPMRVVAQADNSILGNQTSPLNFTKTTQSAIETTMEDVTNSDAYDRITQRVLANRNTDQNPMDAITMEVLKELKGGNIRVQPNIFMPELPQVKTSENDDRISVVIDAQRQPKETAKNEQSIMIGGVKLPVRMPNKIDPQIFSEKPAHSQSFTDGEWDFMKPERQQRKDTSNGTVVIGDNMQSPDIRTSSSNSKTPDFAPSEDDAKLRMHKVITNAKKVSDALALQVAPSTGNQHDAQRQSHMQQAMRRTMMELNAQSDTHQEFMLDQAPDMLSDASVKPGKNSANDATFKQMANSIRARLRGANQSGERGDEIIKQEVQKGFTQLRFGAVPEAEEAHQPAPQTKLGMADQSRPLAQAKQQLLGTTEQSRNGWTFFNLTQGPK